MKSPVADPDKYGWTRDCEQDIGTYYGTRNCFTCSSFHLCLSLGVDVPVTHIVAHRDVVVEVQTYLSLYFVHAMMLVVLIRTPV